MPPLYRHVVPNVPAWTAGNGAPCYDPGTGRPVYRAESKMRFVPSWSPDICDDAAWYALVEHSSFVRWSGDAPTVAELTAWAQTDPDTGTTPTFYYNAPTAGTGGWWRYASTGGPFTVAAATSFGFSFRIASGGAFVHSLLWDAANAYWQWRVQMTTLVASRVYYYESDGAIADYAVSMRAPLMTFTSAQLVDDLRPGAAGIALTPSTTSNIMRASAATLYTSH